MTYLVEVTAVQSAVREYLVHESSEIAQHVEQIIAAVPPALAAAVPADLAEAGKVLEGVTPGPWAYNSHREVGPLHTEDDQAFGMICNAVCEVNFDADHPANARFIAWTREGVPALLARIAAQEVQIKGLEAGDAEATRLMLGAQKRMREYKARAEAAETALTAERAKVAKLVEAARDAEYDLLEWLECGEHLTKAGFNMDGTPEVVRNLTAALREFQEKYNAEV